MSNTNLYDLILSLTNSKNIYTDGIDWWADGLKVSRAGYEAIVLKKGWENLCKYQPGALFVSGDEPIDGWCGATILDIHKPNYDIIHRKAWDGCDIELRSIQDKLVWVLDDTYMCFVGWNDTVHLHHLDLTKPRGMGNCIGELSKNLFAEIPLLCKNCYYYTKPIHNGDIHCGVNPSYTGVQNYTCREYEAI